MKIRQIVELLGGKLISGEPYLENEVDFAFASDLMSDVLTINMDKLLLITGLTNLQAIRTAEMADIPVIVFARDKKVSSDMVSLAEENNMVLIECCYSVYKTSGILYGQGLKALY